MFACVLSHLWPHIWRPLHVGQDGRGEGGKAGPGWMQGEVITLAWRCSSTMMLLSPTVTSLRPNRWGLEGERGAGRGTRRLSRESWRRERPRRAVIGANPGQCQLSEALPAVQADSCSSAINRLELHLAPTPAFHATRDAAGTLYELEGTAPKYAN